jgi:hypothetical protein
VPSLATQLVRLSASVRGSLLLTSAIVTQLVTQRQSRSRAMDSVGGRTNGSGGSCLFLPLPVGTWSAGGCRSMSGPQRGPAELSVWESDRTKYRHRPLVTGLLTPPMAQ